MCFQRDPPRTGSVIPLCVSLGKWAMLMDAYPDLHRSPFSPRKEKNKKEGQDE